MTWTFTNLVIQIVTGILGAHIAAGVSHEHSFGFLGHTAAGVIAGALSGYFLQTLAATVVTASGSLNDVRPVDNAVIQGATGLCVGAIAMLTVGYIRHMIDQHRSGKV